uniref:Transposase n=1 Tax=Strongyloides papillosus TaxID=174720 RepID=A0A0N5BGZ5_STREA
LLYLVIHLMCTLLDFSILIKHLVSMMWVKKELNQKVI